MKLATTQTALITGASSGIGRSLALELARRSDARITISARRQDRLSEVSREIDQIRAERGFAGAPTQVIEADLATREGRLEFLRKLSPEDHPYQLVINNAGFGSVGSFERQDLERERDMVELNCLAPLEICHALIPQMKRHRTGYIVNVASICAYAPMPYMATYGGTKAFLFSFSAALNAELRGSGVSIGVLAPGPTTSEFHLAAGLAEKIDVLHSMSSETVAKQCLDGVDRASPIVVNGLSNWAMANVARICGATLSARVVERMLRHYRSV